MLERRLGASSVLALERPPRQRGLLAGLWALGPVMLALAQAVAWMRKQLRWPRPLLRSLQSLA